MSDAVVVERRQHVLSIRLDRPKRRNALDWDGWVAFSNAWNLLIDDPDLWVGVVTGTGDRAFSAGADLKALPAQIAERRAAGDPAPFPPMAFNTTFCPKPLIAAINGDALGGGLELALACDLRIAADHARFGLPEAKWGGLPGAGGTQRLPRAVPVSVALELMFTAKFIDAAEALAVRLVNNVVPLADLEAATEHVVDQVLAAGPLAVRAIKRAALDGLERRLDEGLQLERDVLDELMDTDDYRNGIGAFAEGRSNTWTAR